MYRYSINKIQLKRFWFMIDLKMIRVTIEEAIDKLGRIKL